MMTNAPIDHLTEPTPEDPIPDPVELILNGNIYSPTYWANYILAKTIGVDPLAYATNYIAGDWQAMQKAGQAIKNMADYNSAFSSTVFNFWREADGTWDGNAASSAGDYFDKLTDVIREQVSPMNNIGTDIETFAQSAYYVAQGISYMIQDIIDTAIIAGIKWVAAKAAEASVYGAAAGAALEASVVYDMLKIIARWREVLAKFTDLATASETAIGAILAGVATVRSKELPTLSESSYDHPGV